MFPFGAGASGTPRTIVVRATVFASARHMGKKTQRKPAQSWQGRAGPGNEQGGLGLRGWLLLSVIVAVVAALAAFYSGAANMWVSGDPRGAPAAMGQRKDNRQAKRPQRPSAGGFSAEEEQLQQGRLPDERRRARCTDAIGCSARVSAEKCAEDKALQSKCCRSCLKLTCVDTEASCEEWAFQGEVRCACDFSHATPIARNAQLALPRTATPLVSGALTASLPSRFAVHRQPALHEGGVLRLVLARP